MFDVVLRRLQTPFSVLDIPDPVRESSDHFAIAVGPWPLLNDWICLDVRSANRWMTVGFAWLFSTHHYGVEC